MELSILPDSGWLATKRPVATRGAPPAAWDDPPPPLGAGLLSNLGASQEGSAKVHLAGLSMNVNGGQLPAFAVPVTSNP